jgi:hypothetical protein
LMLKIQTHDDDVSEAALALSYLWKERLDNLHDYLQLNNGDFNIS